MVAAGASNDDIMVGEYGNGKRDPVSPATNHHVLSVLVSNKAGVWPG